MGQHDDPVARARARFLARQLAEERQDPPSRADTAAAERADKGFLGATLSNVLPSLGQAASGMVTAVTHPIDTAMTAGALALGVVEKFIPGNQKHEALANEVGQALLDRYGSLGKIRDTIQSDPVGVALDVSGILSVGGTAATRFAAQSARAAQAGQAARTAARAMNPISVTGSVSNDVLSRVGRRLKQTAITLNKTQMKAVSRAFDVPEHKAVRRVAQEMFDHRLNPTSKSLARIDKALDELNTAKVTMEEGVMGSPSRALISARKELMGGPLGQSGRSLPARRAIERGLGQSRQDPNLTRVVTLPNGKKVRRLRPMSAHELEQVKQAMSDGVEFYNKQGISKEIDKAISRGFRRELERVIPQIKANNLQQSKWINVRKALKDATVKAEERGFVNIPEFAAAGATLLTGNPLMLGVASLGRPRVASVLGQAVGDIGTATRAMTAPPVAAGVNRAGDLRNARLELEQRLGRPLTAPERQLLLSSVR